ncbi:DUF397 domain-containing protein [Pseudonocardia sp. CA-107938]|uniref:DUF397 domain-containing protein n=1 Tax=Pseudonocardia sp. CA-107938 TaxID=3240021 RepID=UPI003D8F3CF6
MTETTTTLQWRKSKVSQSNGSCVELAALPSGMIAVRDSKDPAGATLIFTRAEMRAWVEGARAGEFDDLT